MFKQQNLYCFIFIVVVVGVEYFSDCNGYHLISESYNNNLRFKRESGGCRETQFLCNNGQCISIHNYCNGKSDCLDESDEILNCNTNGCSSHKFKCAYGACINAELKCDGKQDCRDNSDEDAKICDPLKPGRECPSPVIENGKCEVVGYPKYVSGDPIPNYATLNFTCINENYALTTADNLVHCINGNFESELPKCVSSCAAIFSTSIDVECELNDIKLNCSKKLPEGTIASMKCKTHYEEIGSGPTAAICTGGSWDVPLKRCIPECGELVPEAQLLIVNGTATKKGEFPWHVGIYRQLPGILPIYGCGGSIISVKLILSAASCFTNPNDGELYPIYKLSVAAGKYFSDWDAAEDTDFVQKRKVSKVEYPKDIYFGEESFYAGDIAVVVVDKPFVLTNLVKPVCVDWDSKYVDTHLNSGSLGKVAGWGYNIPGNKVPSVDLKQITVPFIDRRKCFKIAERYFRPLITIDKYCAGYTNGTSICVSDDGGGMVFPQQEYNKKRYYIQGIASIFHAKDDDFCDYHQLAIYTKVVDYIEFIKRIKASNNVECDGKQDCRDNSEEDAKISEPLKTGGECPSPVIENGKYEVSGNSQYVSGDPIQNYASVNFSCINGHYALTTINNIVHCINGNFESELPKCVPSCAAILSTSIDVECELNDVKLDCSKKVPEGTIASMKCKTHFEEIGRGPPAAICSGGSWDVPLKRCIPECGELVPEPQLLIVNGTAAKKGEFPWHVAIYRQEPEEPLEYRCGGSIISVKLVLSAASCFTKSNDGELYPISKFSVAAGKYFSDWDAPEDADFVQKRKVFKVEYPKDIYFGGESSYAGDIAVVVVDKPFVLTNLVKPVCVDWDSKYVDTHLTSGSLGKVAGWGYNIPGNKVPSVDLKQITVPFIDRRKCFKIGERDFRPLFTIDKYCAGYTNGTSICKSDDGGGMVFSQQEYKKRKYYIQGIASVYNDKDDSCDDHQLGFYIKVDDYIKFIKRIEASNYNVNCDVKYCDYKKPEDCLPPVIQNGNYRLITTDEFYTYTSEQPIPNHTLLNITCINTNYVLSTSYSTLYCEEGNYTQGIPKCVLTCSPKFPTSIDVDCKYNDLKEDCTKEVREGTIAHMKCKPGFIDKNPEISNITCTKYGRWNGPPKHCSSPNMCPPRLSTAIDVSCELNGIKQDCNKDVLEGTISHMKCKPNYVDVNDGPSIAYCSNGAWSLPPKKCIPDCEKVAPEGQAFIVNGGSTNRGDFPWHVAIYRQEPQKPIAYICGGSIISVKIVITAAHCLTDTNNGNIYPASEFFMAAGKKYSKWNATEDEIYVQTKKVIKIHTPRDTYFGQFSNYAGDIAVVVVDQLFNFTTFITPVCLDWNLEYSYVNEQFKNGELGKVAGWGSVTTGNPTTSVKLRQLILPYVKRDKCVKIVPIRFIEFITVDKYCAGYTNGSSVCGGDSGGGMVFPRHNNNGIKKYYLQGIVSVGPTKDGSCDNYQLGVYTKVLNYITFIREIEESNRV